MNFHSALAKLFANVIWKFNICAALLRDNMNPGFESVYIVSHFDPLANSAFVIPIVS